MDPRTPTSPLMDVDPQTQQILLVKSLLLQPTSTHLSFSSNSCCPTRDALRVQSDHGSWILITISSTRFHHLRVPLLWSYPHPVNRFSQRRWNAGSQERRLSLSTYPVIQESKSVCSSKPKEASPTYSHSPRNGVHFPLPHL